MKKQLVLLVGVACVHLTVWPDVVYDGYEAYYLTRNSLFSKSTPIQFLGSRNTVVSWRGKRIDLTHAKAFPGEFTANDDLGSNAKAYENFPFACVEGQSSSASGTGVRYVSMYLMWMQSNQQVIVYKLPSLFASCLSIRLDALKRPLFDNPNYIYPPGADLPSGVQLDEYAIDKDKFVPTTHSVKLDFIEQENVWKFRIRTSN